MGDEDEEKKPVTPPSSPPSSDENEVENEVENNSNSEEEEEEEDEEESEEEDEEESEEESDSDSDTYDEENELRELENKDPALHKVLVDVRNELISTEPDIKVLLSTPLTIKDRARLCQIYEIYKNTEPNTDDWLAHREMYNTMFKEFKNNYEQLSSFSPDEIEHMNKEEEELKKQSISTLDLRHRILSLQTSTENKAIIYRRYEELQSVLPSSDEHAKLKHWLGWAIDIPHDKIEKINVDNSTPTEFITNAKKILDESLFGMDKVKEQLLLYISAKISNPQMKKSNLALMGPPGVGKTHIARMISNILNIGFEQISFGGIDKPDFLKGHEYTYVGAQPGEIVKCLKKIGSKNGVIFLDELDKISNHPDICAALLHLVDQSQNTEYHDNFLGEVTIDLSHLWYIASMNKLPEDRALADRWWVIEVPGYTHVEKANILTDYLLPNSLTNNGIQKGQVTIHKDAVSHLIQKVSSREEKGVRSLQKSVADLVNKIHFIVTHQNEEGQLPFSTSFNLPSKISYPVCITQDIIDILLDTKELDKVLNSMYI
jgi:ATP-dependent Lon protease